MIQEKPGHRAPARDWRVLLAAVCIAQATAIIGFDFTLPFVPLYLQHDLGVQGLGATALWAGLIGFGPAIPATIFGPIWGRLADRFGYRAMLLRAMGAAALLLTVMGLAPNPGVLLALRMLQGALTGTIFSSQALVAASVPESETARSMGLLQMSVFVGATFGPVGGGVVAQALGFRAPFLAAGLLLAGAAAIVFLFVHEPDRRERRRPAAAEKRPSIISLLAMPSFAAAVTLTATVQLSNTALFPIVPLFVQDLLGTTHGVASDTGWVMALSGITAATGSYCAGRLQRHVGLRVLLAVFLVAAAGLLLPQSMAPSYSTFLVLRAVAAFAIGGLVSLVGTLAAVSSPANAKGTAFGLVGAASSMGFGAGPLLGGAIAAAFGIRTVFVLAAMSMIALPVALFVLATGGRALRSVFQSQIARAQTD